MSKLFLLREVEMAKAKDLKLIGRRIREKECELAQMRYRRSAVLRELKETYTLAELAHLYYGTIDGSKQSIHRMMNQKQK